jgi:hypothetical protein
MAKKQKVNKTKAVADYLKTHPKAMSSEIAQALGKKGIKITPGHVSNIKSKIKKVRAERKAVGAKLLAGIHAKQPVATEPAVATAAAEKPAKDTLTLEHVKAVAKTVKAIGGFDRLNELLGVIKEVGGIRRFKDLLEAMAVPEAAEIKLPF